MIDFEKNTNYYTSPHCAIEYIFEHLDENGVVYIPHLTSDKEEEGALRCRLEDFDLEEVTEKFNKIKKSLKRIAESYEEIEDEASARRILGYSYDYTVWEKYVKYFSYGDFDKEEINDIAWQMDVVEDLRGIARKFANGEVCNENERLLLTDYMEIEVKNEERELYDSYVEYVYAQAEERVGKKIWAYRLVIHGMRLCKLYSLNAPEIIINNEEVTFATSLVLHEYGKSMETVDEGLLLNQIKLDLMTEEELDDYFSPKKINSRKSLAPLFV